MKKRICLLAAALALALGLAVSASAAEPTGIRVQLDGKNLEFTDAVPQVRDQRTFLPFRAVFESMGAEVSNEGNVITAVRDGKTLTMTIGSTEAVVTENGVDTPIAMDVAPYVDNATWRTYVPVRFAAQAFGCNVGWDQEAMTAILVDTDKLVDETLAAHSFTYMEKYLAYAEKYQTGIWNTDLTYDGSISMMGIPIPFAGTAKGITEGSEKLEMDMTMTMDMAPFLQAMQQMSEAMGQPAEPLSAEDQAMMDALATEGMGIAMRGDLSKGLLHMNMTGSALEGAGMDSAVWYSMDLNAALAQSGMDFGELMQVSKRLDYKALARMAVNSVKLTDASLDYATLNILLDSIAGFFADESFLPSAEDPNRYVSALTYELEGISFEASMALDMQADAVTGYDLLFAASLFDENGATAMGAVVKASADANDQMVTEVTMAMSELVGVQMKMAGGYTKGDTAPITEPPAGASVVPFESMAGSVAGL